MSDGLMNDYVWSASLDEKYLCVVRRTGEYSGSLEILEGEACKFSQEVGLAYGAVFGPDVSDVAQWQDTCIQWVDSQQET